LTPAEGRRFGLVVGAAFLALTALFWVKGWTTAAFMTGAVSTLLLLGAVAVPGRMGPVHRAWMGFALALSRVTTPIFMSVVFYGVLTPTGLLKRLFSGNPVRRPRRSGSYWVDRSPAAGGRSDLERQF
jgi:hypothetical protein